MEIFKLFGSVVLNDNVSNALDLLEGKVKKTDSNIAKLGDTFKRVGSIAQNIGGAMTKFFTLPALAAGGAAAKIGIDYEAAFQQVNRTLGQNSKSIIDWSKNNALSFNMAQSDAVKYASVYSNLLSSFEKDTSKNADLTQQLLQQSSVVASATGRSMEDVMERIRSGLLGNTEAIEDLGINVNVSMLESTDAFKRFAGDKSWNQLDFQTQQQIRLFAILEQSTAKYGNEVNKNTSSSIQQLVANLKNLGLSISQFVLPAINPIIEKISSFLQWLNSLDDRVKGVILTIIAIVAVIGPLLLIFGTLISTIGSAVIAFQAIAAVAGISVGAVAGIAAIIPIVIAAVIALAIAIAANWDWIKETFTNFINWLGSIFTTDWSQKFGVLGGVLNDWLSIIKGIFDNIKSVFMGLIDFIQGVFTGNWSQAWNGVVSIFKGIFGAIASFAKAPLNAVIALINGAIRGLNRLSVNIPDWVPGFGGRSFGVNLPQIPMLANGGNVTNGDAIVGEAGAELLSVKNGRATVTPLTDSQRNSTSNRPQIIQLVIDGKVLAETVAENQDTIDRFNSRDIGGALAW